MHDIAGEVPLNLDVILSADLALRIKPPRCITPCMSTDAYLRSDTPGDPGPVYGARAPSGWRGVSQHGDVPGCRAKHVSTWLHDQVRPSDQKLRSRATRCGVSLDWLRTGEVPFPRSGVATMEESARSSTDRASDYGSEG